MLPHFYDHQLQVTNQYLPVVIVAALPVIEMFFSWNETKRFSYEAVLKSICHSVITCP